MISFIDFSAQCDIFDQIILNDNLEQSYSEFVDAIIHNNKFN